MNYLFNNLKKKTFEIFCSIPASQRMKVSFRLLGSHTMVRARIGILICLYLITESYCLQGLQPRMCDYLLKISFFKREEEY